MAAVSSPHIWYPSGYPWTAYDLRKIQNWIQSTSTLVGVTFIGNRDVQVLFDAAAFEVAKQASMDAGG